MDLSATKTEVMINQKVVKPQIIPQYDREPMNAFTRYVSAPNE